MPTIYYPETPQEVIDRAKTDVLAALPDSQPFLPASVLGAIITAIAGRNYEAYTQIQELQKQMFLNTATGEFLAIWGYYVNILQNAATAATGNITLTGTAGTVVEEGTIFQNVGAIQFKINADVTLSLNSQTISSLTRSGTTATATTSSSHGLASGQSITISGANETAYNGTVIITVTSLSTFTYTVSGSPATPATGTVLVSYTGATASVTAIDFGEDGNQPSGAILTVASPIIGLNDNGIVQYGELGGGADIEDEEDYRARIIFRYQNPHALFNAADIETQTKKVSGVTRVWVEEVTPAVGQVTIYFVRDNDISIIPSGSEITTVKNKLLEIKPANTDYADVIVLAPTAVAAAFVFTDLSPNTLAMRTAITQRLGDLFKEETNVGEDLIAAAYLGAIYSTVDSAGNRIASFALSSPSGDVSIADGELATLGSITFPV